MDELDRKILGVLQIDGRASNAKIAREVKVSEGTVRRRLKRLVERREIRVVALPDPQKLGLQTEALIGIQVEPGKNDDVARALSQMEEVQWATVTTGAYDVFITVALPSPESLHDFIRRKASTIPGVRRTETFISLSVKKRAYGVVSDQD